METWFVIFVSIGSLVILVQFPIISLLIISFLIYCQVKAEVVEPYIQRLQSHVRHLGSVLKPVNPPPIKSWRPQVPPLIEVDESTVVTPTSKVIPPVVEPVEPMIIEPEEEQVTREAEDKPIVPLKIEEVIDDEVIESEETIEPKQHSQTEAMPTTPPATLPKPDKTQPPVTRMTEVNMTVEFANEGERLKYEQLILTNQVPNGIDQFEQLNN